MTLGRAARPLVCWLALVASEAPEPRVALTIPAGTLGDASDMLAQAMGISIVLADPTLLTRKVRGLRGLMTRQEAVDALARQTGVTAQRIAPRGWRLAPSAARAPPPLRRVPPPQTTTRRSAPADDIVVLASKRGMAARWIAGSVERIDLPMTGIDAGTAALVARSTVISSTYRGAGREKLFLRGIADSSFAGQLQSVTGLYLGEVRLTYSAADPDLQLHDIESVEVLQGPQGTLYGTGSLAGIIRLNPAMPERGVTRIGLGGGAAVSAGGAPGTDADLLVNVPLTPDVAIRAVGYGRSEGGFVDRPGAGSNVNRIRSKGARGTVRWWPDADWTVDVVALGQAIRARDSLYVAPPDPRGLLNTREPFASDYAALHLIAAGRIGATRLTSAGGMSSQHSRERLLFDVHDMAGGPAPGLDVERRQRLVSQEVRVSRPAQAGAGWVAGIAWMRSRTIFRWRIRSTIESRERLASEVSELALFGERTLRLSDIVAASVGARAAQVRSMTGIYRTGPGGVEAGSGIRRSHHWLLPTAAATIEPFAALSIYARYQEGRRPAGSNPRPDDRPVPPQDEPLVQPRGDRIVSVEGGIRWRPGHGPSVGIALAHSLWDAVQADVFDGERGLGSANIGDARIVSAHLSADWRIGTELAFDAAMTLNRTRLHPASLPPSGDVRLPNVAEIIARVGARWSREVGAASTLSISGSARYEGRSYATFGESVTGRQGGNLVAGAVATLRLGATEASLAVDNLTDNRGTRFRQGALVIVDARTPLRPATVRLGLRRSF